MAENREKATDQMKIWKESRGSQVHLLLSPVQLIQSDPRGFAVKFYTDEGNWDLTGNNTPIFFIRDALLFPSFIHSQMRNPQTQLQDPDMLWDFWSLCPESLHQVSFLFSDRGLPDGYHHMNGYGSHTFKLINSVGTLSTASSATRSIRALRI
ncbi:hypothetical protein AMELA_G00293890 [Ameiurus melas]|uniref:Catalase core domain-containing protein n=1 Tax=Ameiurus melas TaxID=219545 RepID=A0A7J5ZM59_AMEME|nr:hypothetical protein AMELA_G00293890 [Ameiurus melas]